MIWTENEPVSPGVETPPPGFFAEFDVGSLFLIVMTMIIAWSLAQIVLIIWKKVRDTRRKRDEESFDEARKRPRL